MAETHANRNLVALAQCPTYPEESWRKTDPLEFFLPDDEVLSASGFSIGAVPSGPAQIWKVHVGEAQPNELKTALQALTPYIGEGASEILFAPENLERIIFLDVRHGQASCLFAGNKNFDCQVSSRPFEPQSVSPESAVGLALAQRLAASSPHEIVVDLKTTPRGTQAPLFVALVHGAPSFSQIYSNVRVKIGENSQADLFIVNNASAAFGFGRHTIEVQKYARARELWFLASPYAAANEETESRHLLERVVRLEEGAEFHDAQIFAPSNGLTRVTSHISCMGKKAFSSSGAAVLAAQSVQFDYEPIQEHTVSESQSYLKLKMVLGGKARSVFQGMVKIHRNALRCRAAQENKNLLLGKRARVDASPRLEILPDDVMCKHGSATGEIDQKQMYYLQTRGFTEGDARNLIVSAFVNESFVSFGESEKDTLAAMASELIAERLVPVL